MGRVFVAGSINMDVVATADRHPQVGETVAGKAVHVFSRRQGRQPGGRGREARRSDRADRPAGHGCVRPAVADVSRRAGRRSRASSRTPPRPIPERRSSPSPMPTTPSWSCPAPMRWSAPEDVARRCACQRRRRRQPVRNSAADDPRVLQARARGRRDHDPQSGAGDASSARSCSISSISWSSTKPSSGCSAKTELRDSDDACALRRSRASRCKPAPTRSSA